MARIYMLAERSGGRTGGMVEVHLADGKFADQSKAANAASKEATDAVAALRKKYDVSHKDKKVSDMTHKEAVERHADYKNVGALLKKAEVLNKEAAKTGKAEKVPKAQIDHHSLQSGEHRATHQWVNMGTVSYNQRAKEAKKEEKGGGGGDGGGKEKKGHGGANQYGPY